MNSPAVVNNESQNINLEGVSVGRGFKPFELMRVGLKNLSQKVMELFERGVPIKMLNEVSDFIGQHKRAVVLLGTSGIGILAANSAHGVLIINNGIPTDAIGGSTLRSSGVTNAVRIADSFTVTGNGDNSLVRYSLAGTSVSPGGSQNDISLNSFFLCLYGPTDRWNTPILETQVTPSNSNYTNSIGQTINGYSVHGLDFNLSSIQQLQNLAAGSYKIAVYSTAGGNPNAGELRRITSTPGIGTIGNSFFAGVPAGTVTNDWQSTTTINTTFASRAMNSQLEAVPEPGSVASLALGLAMLLRRRQRDNN